MQNLKLETNGTSNIKKVVLLKISTPVSSDSTAEETDDNVNFVVKPEECSD